MLVTSQQPTGQQHARRARLGPLPRQQGRHRARHAPTEPTRSTVDSRLVTTAQLGPFPHQGATRAHSVKQGRLRPPTDPPNACTARRQWQSGLQYALLPRQPRQRQGWFMVSMEHLNDDAHMHVPRLLLGEILRGWH